MDPKAHPRLDPKLKETYDRIMGMKTGSKPPTPVSSGQVEQVTIDNKPATETAPSASNAPHTTGHLSHIAYNASSKMTKPEEKKHEEVTHEEKKEEHKEAKTSDSMVVPIILGVSGVIFFIFYAIFWMRFFGM